MPAKVEIGASGETAGSDSNISPANDYVSKLEE